MFKRHGTVEILNRTHGHFIGLSREVPPAPNVFNATFRSPRIPSPLRRASMFAFMLLWTILELYSLQVENNIWDVLLGKEGKKSWEYIRTCTRETSKMNYTRVQATGSRRGQGGTQEGTGQRALGGCSRQQAGGNFHKIWDARLCGERP